MLDKITAKPEVIERLMYVYQLRFNQAAHKYFQGLLDKPWTTITAYKKHCNNIFIEELANVCAENSVACHCSGD